MYLKVHILAKTDYFWAIHDIYFGYIFNKPKDLGLVTCWKRTANEKSFEIFSLVSNWVFWNLLLRWKCIFSSSSSCRIFFQISKWLPAFGPKVHKGLFFFLTFLSLDKINDSLKNYLSYKLCGKNWSKNGHFIFEKRFGFLYVSFLSNLALKITISLTEACLTFTNTGWKILFVVNRT